MSWLTNIFVNWLISSSIHSYGVNLGQSFLLRTYDILDPFQPESYPGYNIDYHWGSMWVWGTGYGSVT